MCTTTKTDLLNSNSYSYIYRTAILEYRTSIFTDLNTEVADATQTIGNTGFFLAQPVVVWDADIISASQELILLSLQQVLQPLWPWLLHALKHKLWEKKNRLDTSAQGHSINWFFNCLVTDLVKVWREEVGRMSLQN